MEAILESLDNVFTDDNINYLTQANLIDQEKYFKFISKKYNKRRVAKLRLRRELLKSNAGLDELINLTFDYKVSKFTIKLVKQCMNYIESFGDKYIYLRPTDINIGTFTFNDRTFLINRGNNRESFYYKAAILIQTLIDNVQFDETGCWTSINEKRLAQELGSSTRGYSFDIFLVLSALRGIGLLSDRVVISSPLYLVRKYYFTNKYFINHSKKTVKIPHEYCRRLVSHIYCLSDSDRENLINLMKYEPTTADYKDALKYISSTKFHNTSEYLQNKFKNVSQARLVKAFKEKDILKLSHYYISRSCGRRFTAMTQLKGDIRQSMYFIDGQPSVELDIRSSQAFQLLNISNLFYLHKENKLSSFLRFEALNELTKVDFYSQHRIKRLVELHNINNNTGESHEDTNAKYDSMYDTICQRADKYPSRSSNISKYKYLSNYVVAVRDNNGSLDFEKINLLKLNFITLGETILKYDIQDSVVYDYFKLKYKQSKSRINPYKYKIELKHLDETTVDIIEGRFDNAIKRGNLDYLSNLNNIDKEYNYLHRLVTGKSGCGIAVVAKLYFERYGEDALYNLYTDSYNSKSSADAILKYIYSFINNDKLNYWRKQLVAYYNGDKYIDIERVKESIANQSYQINYVIKGKNIAASKDSLRSYDAKYEKVDYLGRLNTLLSKFNLPKSVINRSKNLYSTECTELQECLESKDFYSELALRGEFIYNLSDMTEELRKTIKKLFCQVVYGKVPLIYNGGSSNIQRMAKALGSFDNGKLLKIINKYKYKKWNLALDVMNIESFYMMICSKILNLKHCSVTTIHDCIKVPIQDASFAYETMKLISEILNFKYEFKFEYKCNLVL